MVSFSKVIDDPVQKADSESLDSEYIDIPSLKTDDEIKSFQNKAEFYKTKFQFEKLKNTNLEKEMEEMKNFYEKKILQMELENSRSSTPAVDIIKAIETSVTEIKETFEKFEKKTIENQNKTVEKLCEMEFKTKKIEETLEKIKEGVETKTWDKMVSKMWEKHEEKAMRYYSTLMEPSSQSSLEYDQLMMEIGGKSPTETKNENFNNFFDWFENTKRNNETRMERMEQPSPMLGFQDVNYGMMGNRSTHGTPNSFVSYGQPEVEKTLFYPNYQPSYIGEGPSNMAGMLPFERVEPNEEKSLEQLIYSIQGEHLFRIW